MLVGGLYTTTATTIHIVPAAVQLKYSFDFFFSCRTIARSFSCCPKLRKTWWSVDIWYHIFMKGCSIQQPRRVQHTMRFRVNARVQIYLGTYPIARFSKFNRYHQREGFVEPNGTFSGRSHSQSEQKPNLRFCTGRTIQFILQTSETRVGHTRRFFVLWTIELMERERTNGATSCEPAANRKIQRQEVRGERGSKKHARARHVVGAGAMGGGAADGAKTGIEKWKSELPESERLCVDNVDSVLSRRRRQPYNDCM